MKHWNVHVVEDPTEDSTVNQPTEADVIDESLVNGSTVDDVADSPQDTPPVPHSNSAGSDFISPENDPTSYIQPGSATPSITNNASTYHWNRQAKFNDTTQHSQPHQWNQQANPSITIMFALSSMKSNKPFIDPNHFHALINEIDQANSRYHYNHSTKLHWKFIAPNSQ